MDTLSPEQSDVVGESVDSKLLILAGAGTGKTHVMVHRVAHLITESENNGPTQVLLLTFTRAVARELRDRIKAQGRAVRFVRSYTLDSFATTILREHNPNEVLPPGFDSRIVKATRMLSDPQMNMPPRLTSIGHIFIDEIQDLVGPRLRMIRALLTKLNCGFSVMGDPAQAIYGEQSDSRNSQQETLFDWVRHQYPQLQEVTFNTNYRAASDQAKLALSVGSELREQSPDFKRLYEKLRNQLCFNPAIREYQSPQILRRGIKTAFLSGTNCESLLISEELSAIGVPHTVRLRSSERAVAAWVPVVLQGIKTNDILESAYSKQFEALKDSGFDNLPSQKDGWDALVRLSRTGNNIVRASSIVDRIRDGLIPEEITDRRESTVVVSTIHSAKGLEFDSVIVTKPDHKFVRNDNYAAAARMLFVAMSRTRKFLRYRGQPNMLGWFVPHAGWNSGNTRWIKRSNGDGDGNLTTGLEVRPGDIDDDRIPFLEQEITGTINDWQKTVFDNVTEGDEIVLVIEEQSNRPERKVSYRAIHKKSTTCLGYTSAGFASLLRSALNRGYVTLPDQIQGLRISGFEAAAVNPAMLTRGNDSIRIWPKPTIIGLGTWANHNSRAN